MSLFRTITIFAVATTAAAAQWGGPDMYTDCKSCTNSGHTWQDGPNVCTSNCAIADASCTRSPVKCTPEISPELPQYSDCYSCTKAGLTWQKEARSCTMNCAIQDISCTRYPSQCQGSHPPPPPPKPSRCDCYVDLRNVKGYSYNYIMMWKKNPCSGKSLGSLSQGRCLTYTSPDAKYNKWNANCGSGKFSYIKMRTQSGQSVGWVASQFLDCGNKPMPPPAPAPAAAASSSNEGGKIA